MSESSRQRAQSWPYKRHRDFERSLQDAATDWFNKRGFQVQGKYKYILADWNDWPNNILLPQVASYIKQQREERERNKVGFPLHKYIHHGLSSQAMLFNLVGSLIVNEDLEPLRVAFERAGVLFPKGTVRAAFEIEDRGVFNEDSGQPTSIDLVIEGEAGGASLFVESKLVEREFGGCSVFADGDCDGRNPVPDLNECYLHYILRGYWKRLEEFGFLEGPVKESPICVLGQYYQFFRECLFALAKGGYFVLLFDKRNPTFLREASDGARGLLPLLTSFVPEGKRDRVRSVSIHEVVQAIKESSRHGDWIGEFERKYGMAGNEISR